MLVNGSVSKRAEPFFLKENDMNTFINLSHHTLLIWQAFGFALASMGLGLEGAAAHEDDQFFKQI